MAKDDELERFVLIYLFSQWLCFVCASFKTHNITTKIGGDYDVDVAFTAFSKRLCSLCLGKGQTIKSPLLKLPIQQ